MNNLTPQPHEGIVTPRLTSVSTLAFNERRVKSFSVARKRGQGGIGGARSFSAGVFV